MAQVLKDYEVRLLNEYNELAERIDKLEAILSRCAVHELDFVPECTFEQLDDQLAAMRSYKKALIRRNDFRRLIADDGQIHYFH